MTSGDDENNLLKDIFGAGILYALKNPVYKGFQGTPAPNVFFLSKHKTREKKRRELGAVEGNYHLFYIDHIKLQKRLGQYDEAIELLLKIVDAVEREAAEFEEGVAPWYYEQLAIIYRKQKRHADEVAILERYAAADKAAGRGPDRMADRLIKAKILAAKAV